MHRNRRAVVATILSLLLGAGIFAAFTLSGGGTALADTANLCSQVSGAPSCSNSIGVENLSSAQLAITATADAGASASPTLSGDTTLTANPTDSADLTYSYKATWSSNCTYQGTNQPGSAGNNVTGTLTSGVEQTWTIALPFANNDSCLFTATVTLSGTPGTFPVNLEVLISYSPETATSPTPSASSSSASSTHYYNQVSGFDGMCLDDSGNSSADRAKIMIWNCNSTDAAQGWSYSGSELHHGNMCLNAKGTYPRDGAILMLWSCNGGANEIFIHKSNGEYELKAGGYKMCVNDPGYSTHRGTQLIVWNCQNTPNEHWGLP